MVLKKSFVCLRLPNPTRASPGVQCRYLHRLNAPTLRIPKPTPFVPDVQTFLTLIGRGLAQHAAKIASWEALFSLSSQQLKESGIEPARARRYLLWWRERFRNGIVGVGGDMTHVEKGVGELRIVEVPSSRPIDQIATLSKDPGMRKMIINTPRSVSDAAEIIDEEESIVTATTPPPRIDASEATPLAGMKIVQGSNIGGRGVKSVKGHQGVARLSVEDGLWEQRRGHKVDGGERRKAEVRSKRRAQERKKAN